MKKIFLLLLTVFLMTGCSLFKDNLENAQIYTTIYPIKFLTEKLYGEYSTIESIYPNGANINKYKLKEKQIKNFSKGDLFIYNGLSNEKNYAKNLINENKKLLIIDVSNGLNYKNSVEELWMSPNNFLMLAKNIRDNLNDYLTSKIIKKEINKNYDELAEVLSKMDADLRSIGRDANKAGRETLIVSDDAFLYLENYGFKIISLDKDTVAESTINNIKNAFKKKTYKSIIVLDNEVQDDIRKSIKDNNIKVIPVNRMIFNTTPADDYVSQMQTFIDNIRNLTVKD